MITNKELSEVTLSPTKKDYYQIWNELIELADKISYRWSPASTNESDPGIVLLKALTAIADKLNYNIDKNTLEAFMPSAAQEESMRKLTEMMGYDMKHYRSATGKAVISYKATNTTPIEDFAEGIYFPKFINLKNEDEDINYLTLEEFRLQAGQESREVAIIEGELIECESNNDNIITALHLDDLNRYILPEYAIAENGIFVTNITDTEESVLWKREQNLNVQQPGSKVYKVGVDSTLQLPYIQFPNDIRTLIEDGLKIKYVRTNGLSGNIAAKTLSKLEKPAIWATSDSDSIKKLSAGEFLVNNASAAANGANPETLTAAYNNYKKTVGTFDTLVTCRDYMNKIYQMTESETDTTPLVSNVIVSDIRDDINRSIPICTFNEYGICYKDASLIEPIILSLPAEADGTPTQVRYTKNKIEHFDLVIYPFKPIYGINNKTEYKNSFKYTAENVQKIQADLALNKTIAHNIVEHLVGINDGEIACIKNYLKLKARVSTTKKVTLIEEAEILNNIYKAIYANFNSRQVDFGEELPYDSLLTVLKNADYRIKEVSLDEPALSTKFCLIGGEEIPLKAAEEAIVGDPGDILYNSLALRNVLAGKISAFNYNDDFVAEYDKTGYPSYLNEQNREQTYALTYPEESDYKITSITSSFNVGEAFQEIPDNKKADGLTLKENEVIQFRLPNFKTIKTYPAYVNYYLKLQEDSIGGVGAAPATFQSLGAYLSEEGNWAKFVNSNDEVINKLKILDTSSFSTEEFNNKKADYGTIFKKEIIGEKDTYNTASVFTKDTEYFYLVINDDLFVKLNSWVRTQIGNHGKNLLGIYRTTGVQEKPFGNLIDVDLKKYWPAYKFGISNTNGAANSEILSKFFIQVTHDNNDSLVVANNVTADGLGRDADYQGVPINGEYQLKSNEYLLINYTDSKTDESGAEQKSVVNLEYLAGTVIRANFNLIDSDRYNVNHSWSKRDKFNFANHPNLPGMFTLGTNEQIEIRDLVKINLEDDVTYLYWELNSDDPEALSNPFNFTEDYGIDPNSRKDQGGISWGTVDEPIHNAYTLKEGEHLYYTNSKKQDLVYYGAGTLIVKNSETPPLIKYTSSGAVSEDEIMTNGLAAAIPWQKYSLNTAAKRLEIIENQYISLTEGDTLLLVNDQYPTKTANNLTNTWTEIKSAAYRFAEDTNNTAVPMVAVPSIAWTARSRLDFNMSQTVSQPLNIGDSLSVTLENKTTLADGQVLEIKPQRPKGMATLLPLYINSNYTCQAAVDTLNISNSLGNALDLKLKITSKVAPTTADGANLTLNNYVNGEAKYTKFDFANLSESYTPITPAFTLNIGIPKITEADKQLGKVSFGLMMLYYIEDLDAAKELTYTAGKIIAVNKDSQIENGLAWFNKESTMSSEKELLPGMNILQITPDVTQLKFYSDSAKKSIVIFGSLDLVSGINPKLDYRITQEGLTSLEQLLQDIKNLEVAADFYYNIPIQKSSEIELNASITDDLLSSPLTWYDINNVNKKFVISEIDADYLTTGITLTKASRV